MTLCKRFSNASVTLEKKKKEEEEKRRIQAFETKCMRKLLLSPTSSRDQRPGVEQDQLPCGSTGTSSGNYQETETCMVRACHTPRQPLLQGGWATPWSVEEMLDRQHQKVDIPANARTAHKGLWQKGLEEDVC